MKSSKSRRAYFGFRSRMAAFAAAITVGVIGSGFVPNGLVHAQASSETAGETVLVVGATGRTGRLVVSELLSRNQKVRGLTRNAKRARKINPAVEWVEGDLREVSSLQGIVTGVDRVVFASGSSAFRDPTNIPEQVEFRGLAVLVDLAVAAKVKHLTMMSSAGVGHADAAATEGFAGVMRWKSAAESYVRTSGLPSYTIVRPSGLSDDPGQGIGIALAQGDAVFANLIHTSRADVASVIVETLYNPAARGKTFEMYNGRTKELDDWQQALARLKED